MDVTNDRKAKWIHKHLEESGYLDRHHITDEAGCLLAVEIADRLNDTVVFKDQIIECADFIREEKEKTCLSH